MKMRAVAVLTLFLAVVSAAALRPALAAPSGPLSNVLYELRTTDDTTFSNVLYWARNGAGWPSASSAPYQRIERDILSLPADDREAVLSWLRGNSRSPLYARGASDADIGPRRPVHMSGAAPTPTPQPYRYVNLASSSIGATQGHVSVLGGFAAFKRDGTGAIICLSFKNNSPKTANRVVFDFTVTGPRGGTLGSIQLDRRGEFATGIDINGWSDLSSWQSGIGHRGYNDNCRYVSQATASNAFLNGTTVTYQVVRVEYDNGSVWTPY